MASESSAEQPVWVSCGTALNGDGTPERPFNSLFSAQNRIRNRLKASDLKGHLYVNVSGDCRLKEPLIITEKDKGTSMTAQVIWRGLKLPGGQTGGARILGSSVVQFTPEKPGSKTWNTLVPRGAETGRNLFIKNSEGFRRAVAARTSAFKFDKNYFQSTGRNAEEDTSCQGAGMLSPFKPTNDISSGEKSIPDGSYLVYMEAFGMQRFPVEPHVHLSPKTTTIPITKPIREAVCRDAEGFGSKAEPWTGWFENLFRLKFMDQPGEWALSEGKAFYVSAPGDQPVGELAHQPTLIRFRETKFVTFTDFEMGFTTWNNIYAYQAYRHTSTLALLESDSKKNNYYHAFYREPAAIELTNSNNISIRRNAFRHLGGSGIQLISGSFENKIEGNLMLDVGITAIEVDSRPGVMGKGNIDKLPAASNRDSIANNFIVKTGEKDWGGMGVLIGFAQNLTVVNNHIAMTAYTGISSGGTLENCWTKEVDKLGSPKPELNCWNRENIFIERNLVERAMWRSQDGGAIYVNGQQPGTVVRNNVIRCMPNLLNDPSKAFVTGIYFDSGSTGMTVESNLVPDPTINIHFHIFKPVTFTGEFTKEFKRYKLTEQHINRTQILERNNGIAIARTEIGLQNPYASWLKGVYSSWRSVDFTGQCIRE